MVIQSLLTSLIVTSVPLSKMFCCIACKFSDDGAGKNKPILPTYGGQSLLLDR